MNRFVLTGVFCALVTGSVFGYDLVYDAVPGTKLQRDIKEESEFTAIADIPGLEQFAGKITGSGKMVVEIKDIDGDYGVVAISGSSESEIEINESAMDPQYTDIGPITLKVTQQGEIEDIEIPKFEADAQSLMRFGWWYHISKQLNLIQGLPMGSVAIGDTWENTSKINSPASGDLTILTKSRVMGSSWNDGKCVWIYSESKLPLKLEFKIEEGEFHVKGKVGMTSVTCFNMDKGFATEEKTYRTADFTVESKASEDGAGQDFNVSMVLASKNESKTQVKEEEKEEASDSAASSGDSKDKN